MLNAAVPVAQVKAELNDWGDVMIWARQLRAPALLVLDNAKNAMINKRLSAVSVETQDTRQFVNDAEQEVTSSLIYGACTVPFTCCLMHVQVSASLLLHHALWRDVHCGYVQVAAVYAQ